MNKFIRSAYEMAMDERANGAAMGFSADGLSLELRDVAVLSARLDKYFNHSKVSSFCRQLNNYGFKKLVPVRSAKGAADGKRLAAAEEAPSLQVFVHPCFQRNRPDLCCQIRRQASGSRTPQPAAAAAAAAATSDDEDDDDEDEDDSAATPSSKPSSNNATIDHLLVLNANLRKHNTDLLQQIQVLREDALLRKCSTCLGTSTMRRSSGEEAQLMFGVVSAAAPTTATTTTSTATTNPAASTTTAPIIDPNNNPFDN